MDRLSKRSFPEPLRPQPTGRLLVRLAPGADVNAVGSSIASAVGLKNAVSAKELDGASSPLEDAANSGSAVIIDEFNIAIVPTAQGEGLRGSAAKLKGMSGIADARPEFFLFAVSILNERQEAWLREAASILAESGAGTTELRQANYNDARSRSQSFADTNDFTWGLMAVGADRTRYTGRKIRVAVLDTGIDSSHPDFQGRSITSATFVGGTAQDVQGHGTHCAGTALGIAKPTTGRRYGVAPDAELFVGKVLDDSGSGSEGGVLLGMRWGIQQKCEVISMSLGRPTFPDEVPDPSYEEAGQAAFAAGSLIVAAAGNESRRDLGYIASVGSPANVESIMAVAALDSSLGVGYFSCGGVGRKGGEVDVAAPGVAVHSSFPRPRNTRTLDGTSMACPHVAGIAALWAESDPSLRGEKLRDAIKASCRDLPELGHNRGRDVGEGLVQAPGLDHRVA